MRSPARGDHPLVAVKGHPLGAGPGGGSAAPAGRYSRAPDGPALWWMRRRNRLKLQELEQAGEILPNASPLLRDR